MQFFTSPEDLKSWVKAQKNPDLAANKIIESMGGKNEQDVVDTCRAICTDKNEKVVDNASKVLYGVLANNKLTELNKSSGDNKMKKVAQAVMREDSLYGNMPMRVCPKLPYSVGKRLISTYNCRHYCIDSFTLDDDPSRVYCAEALWRNNIMDKFSREWRQDDGQLVGGYINERFQVTHNSSGNPMELSRDERTRKPRPHQYSTERRLSEGRDEETYDLMTASNKKMVKLASITPKDDKIYTIYNDIVEMKDAGLTDEDIISKVSEHYGISIFSTVKLHSMAMKQMARHSDTTYTFTKEAAIPFPEKTTMVTKTDMQVTSLKDGKPVMLKMETPVVLVSNKPDNQVFQIVDGQDAGKQFKVENANIDQNLGLTEEIDIQSSADEAGLNEEPNQPTQTTPPTEKTQEFPVEEKLV